MSYFDNLLNSTYILINLRLKIRISDFQMIHYHGKIFFEVLLKNFENYLSVANLFFFQIVSTFLTNDGNFKEGVIQY